MYLGILWIVPCGVGGFHALSSQANPDGLLMFGVDDDAGAPGSGTATGAAAADPRGMNQVRVPAPVITQAGPSAWGETWAGGPACAIATADPPTVAASGASATRPAASSMRFTIGYLVRLSCQRPGQLAPALPA
jgi:hypothetical protein